MQRSEQPPAAWILTRREMGERSAAQHPPRLLVRAPHSHHHQYYPSRATSAAPSRSSVRLYRGRRKFSPADMANAQRTAGKLVRKRVLTCPHRNTAPGIQLWAQMRHMWPHVHRSARQMSRPNLGAQRSGAHWERVSTDGAAKLGALVTCSSPLMEAPGQSVSDDVELPSSQVLEADERVNPTQPVVTLSRSAPFTCSRRRGTGGFPPHSFNPWKATLLLYCRCTLSCRDFSLSLPPSVPLSLTHARTHTHTVS